MRTAIENAVVLTMDDDMRVLDRGYVLTDGKNIAEVGEGAFAGEADERIDARGGILLPGFVNTHCHVSMVPFRTMGDDCPDRLRRFLFPLENEAMTRELVYRGAVFGIGEMLLAGVTTFADMYYFEDEVARACVQTGMRGYLGETLISQPTCDSAQPGGGLAIAKAMFDTWRGEALVRPIVAPHGTTTCDEALLRAGVRFGLGTDGPSSGNTLSLFDQMRLFADCHKTANHDRALFPAKEIVRAATRGGAEALRAGGEFGRLQPGMRADLVLVSVDAPHLFPVYNPYSALVYGANSSDVSLVMVSGETLVRGGKLTRLDMREAKARLLEQMGPFMQSAAKYADII